MKLIEKYIYREYLKAVFYCITTFSLLFVVADLFARLDKYMSAKTPASLIGLHYWYYLIETSEFIIPSCLMLATLFTLLCFSRNNEIIAMRSSGISMLRIIMPFLVVGIFFSICISIMKQSMVPYSSEWLDTLNQSKYKEEKFKELRNHKLFNFPYSNMTKSRQWRIDEFEPDKPDSYKGVAVISERADGTRISKITANHAEWLDGQWWFHDAEIQAFSADDSPDGRPHPLIPGTNTIVQMKELDEQPIDFIASSKKAEFLSVRALRHYINTHRLLPEKTITQLRVDLHARFALPWACLVATLFAIPVGSKSSRQSFFINILIAVAALFMFYTLVQFGLILGKTGQMWPWLSAWLSNIVFLIIGQRMSKDIM